MIKRSYDLTITPREDGGLRVYSPDEMGLLLSGPDPKAVMSSILPALEMLADHAARSGMMIVDVGPLRSEIK